VFYLDVAKLDLDITYVFKCFRRLKTFVSSVSSGCCKKDWDVAYVAMTKYTCCKPTFQVFQVFHTYVSIVLS
jgi:hypothetical protein